MNKSKINVHEISKNTKKFKNIIYKESITSTNDFALNLIKTGLKEETVIIVNEQIRGRGRSNKKFFSPSNEGIYMSIILKCDLPLSRFLFAITSIAIVKALKSLNIEAEIKWPNDIFIEKKKVCGILIESVCDSNGNNNFSVIGIGINVYNSEDELFKKETNFATSLKIENYANINRNKLISKILIQFEDVINEETEIIIAEYKKYLIKNYNQLITFKGENLFCKIKTLDSQGFAIAESANNKLLKLC